MFDSPYHIGNYPYWTCSSIHCKGEECYLYMHVSLIPSSPISILAFPVFLLFGNVTSMMTYSCNLWCLDPLHCPKAKFVFDNPLIVKTWCITIIWWFEKDLRLHNGVSDRIITSFHESSILVHAAVSVWKMQLLSITFKDWNKLISIATFHTLPIYFCIWSIRPGLLIMITSCGTVSYQPTTTFLFLKFVHPR